jgi:hypothetical protein
MITVRMNRFISSGDSTTHGRVFLISLPPGRIQIHEEDVEPGDYHSHSSFSHSVSAKSSSSASSPAAAMVYVTTCLGIRYRRPLAHRQLYRVNSACIHGIDPVADADSSNPLHTFISSSPASRPSLARSVGAKTSQLK